MNGLLKNTFRRIWRTKGRFLSIMAIIAIGSGFFAGVKATSPDMKDTADKYYDDCELMDFRFKSQAGFELQDIERLKGLAGVSEISAGYSADAYMQMDGEANEIVRVYSFDFDNFDLQFNRPVLLEGRLPQNADECLIEANSPCSVGDRVSLELDTTEQKLEDYLGISEFVAVGKVMWPMYVDFERGAATIGNGVVQSYLIVPEGAFSCKAYTDVYVRVSELEGVYSFGDEFADITNEKKEYYETKCADFALLQGQRLYDENSGDVENARAEYDDARSKYELSKTESDLEFSKIEVRLSEERTELEKQKTDYETKKSESDAQLEKCENDITEASSYIKEYEDSKKSLEASRKIVQNNLELLDELSAAVEGYSRAKIQKPYSGSLAQLYKDLSALNSNEYSVTDNFEDYLAASPGREKTGYKFSLLGYIYEQRPEYQKKLAGVNSDIKNVSDDLAEAERNLNILNDLKTQLDTASVQLAERETLLTEDEEKLSEQEKEFAKSKAEADEKFADASKDLQDAQKKVEDAETRLQSFVSGLKWYVFTRDDNVGYSNYEDDADRVDSIARVFPIFFILVAALVCLTTMTRMVEEQRTETGTLKALGYSRGSIMLQYLLYSALASVIGVVLGLAVCMKLFPYVIFNTYKLMYNYPEVICPYRWQYVVGSLVVALLCTGLSSLAACYGELTEVPSQLMRPRPPKSGKRVALEKLPALWNRLGFLQKVAARNVFRFKNRVLMTVLGIGGCTALLLTGFTLRHSISSIIDLQYGEIFSYDFMMIYDSGAEAEDRELLRQSVSESPLISGSVYAYQKTVNVSSDVRGVDVYLFAPETAAKMSDFISLRERKSGKTLSLADDGVIINEKLARLLKLEKGDSITLSGAPYKLKVSGITENYAYNYIYMTSTMYKELFGAYTPNLVIGSMADKTQEDALSESMLKHSPVQIISYTSVAGKKFSDLIGKLNYIVYLIILSSAALAFVVLYNLSNISITERSRELATIKVLGFRDGEVSAYVYRENVVSALLGVLAGLVGGIFLARFVVRTAEIDMVMFAPDIPWYCYLVSGLLTLVFVLAVNILMFFKLRKINMASSMKAIE